VPYRGRAFEERGPYRQGGRAHWVVEEVSKLPLKVRAFEYEDDLCGPRPHTSAHRVLSPRRRSRLPRPSQGRTVAWI